MTVTADLRRLYADSDALALAELVRARKVSAVELVETAIALADELQPTLNAIAMPTFELARQMAAGEIGQGAFAGVPYLLKNIGSMWEGTPLTNGAAFLQGFVCESDSALNARVRRSGLIPIGRSNAPEFGWSLGTDTSAYGVSRNPWNREFSPGGSSGGAAAAVAAGIVPIAEASDGGGSIRAPAACCGLVGLKPSRGRITYGPDDADVWFGSVATFCVSRSVRDSAAFLDAVAGSDPGDPYVAAAPAGSWLDALAKPPERLRIGLTTARAWGEPTAPEVVEAVAGVGTRCAALGHIVEPHDLPIGIEAVWARYNDIGAVQTAADMELIAERIGRPVREDDLAAFNWANVHYGWSLSAVDHAHSIAAVRKAGQIIARDLHPYDVMLTPVLTQPVPPIGFWSMDTDDREEYLSRWSSGGYLFLFNLSGLPALSIPAGQDRNGLPVGVQLVGRLGDEMTLLRLAEQLSQDVGGQWGRPAL